jgi:WD40 repeat protein
MYRPSNVKRRFKELQQWYAERRQRHINYLQTVERGRVEWSITQLLQQKSKPVDVYTQVKTKAIKKLGRKLLKRYQRSLPLHRKYQTIIIAISSISLLFIGIILSFSWVKIQYLNQQTKQAIEQNQHSQSLHSAYLAHIADLQTAQGNATNGLLISLAALPNEENNKPYIPEAEQQLYHATIQPREHRGLFGHQFAVENSIFSPNGQYLLTLARDQIARLWEVRTGKLLYTFNHGSGINNKFLMQANFSSNNQWLVTTAGDRNARVWDINSGEQLALLTQRGDIITHAIFSPDNQYVITGSHNKTVRIWQFSSERAVSTLNHWQAAVVNLAFSLDGDYLLVGEANGQVNILDTNQYETILTLPSTAPIQAQISHDSQFLINLIYPSIIGIWELTSRQAVHILAADSEVLQLQLLSDTDKIAVLYADNTIKIWSLSTGTLQNSFSLPYNINNISISKDDYWLLTTVGDERALLWNFATQKLLAVLADHDDTVNHAHFSPNGNYIATASQDKSAKLWNFNHDRQLIAFAQRPAKTIYAQFSPNLYYLATAHDDGMVYLWHDKTQIAELKGHKGRVNFLAFSNDSEYLLSAGDDKTVRLWRVISGRQVAIFTEHDSPVNYVAFNFNENRILSVDDSYVYLRDAANHDVIKKFTGKLHNTIIKAEFEPRGRYIALAENNIISLWDAQNGNNLAELVGHENAITHFSFSADGNYLASSSYDKTARIWDLRSKLQKVTILLGHTNVVTYTAFSHDNKYLATVGYDKTARLWSVDSGEEIQVFGEHQDMVMYVMFSPDGRRLLTMDYSNTAHLWDISSGKEVLRFADGQALVIFTPDNRYIFASLLDGHIFLYPYFASTQDLLDYARLTASRQLSSEQKKLFFIE